MIKKHRQHSSRYAVIFACVVLVTIVSSCATPSNTNNYYVHHEPTPAIDTTNKPPTPEPTLQKRIVEKTGAFSGYTYTYQHDGNKTAALFLPRFLPRDDSIVVGAARDVIKRSFGETAAGDPALEDWQGQRAIRLDSRQKSYMVIPVKEDTGEVHSLVITQVAR